MCQLDYVQYVKEITSHSFGARVAGWADAGGAVADYVRMIVAYIDTSHVGGAAYCIRIYVVWYIIHLSHMKRANTGKNKHIVDAKSEALRQQGALHPNPEIVRDEAFQREVFFDPRDLVQVRYEMLRRHKIDGKAVTEVAENFGISRQAYYLTEAAFEKKGIVGLLPRPRGPQRAHKCSDEILDFVEQWRADTSAPGTVSEAVQKRFGISIHPRSLARALARRKKKLP